ncbi:MAG: 23S rRNA (guanosine(2251)-2'-O)-methyltransferase RlmB [Chloroflexi bacterium]|nr:MAG: 23S rRNA (guanosine(2251)-2'-O)-methyltransferase RlmB [Anaerolineaceae bacterium 4572_32.2]RLC78147.1 MAG: 23S rRNA (guanosine(2251)-2'-O)-methyltransferase RlmB [Chloroflexota bacterium]RLC85183.1 MAG: 23S rRNA (guanosine(2251)-2'-O)-methyltransferase RlmB [Chloroflexota bacterium]HEY73289.1 23S rRNA (guanosine(2251)-2'-O)-methyltransferase RlmB [Thermoflexia bacterium]
MREVLYGRNAVRESLRAGRRQAYKLLLAEGVRQTDIVGQIVSLAEQTGAVVQRVERRDLNRLGDIHHQGVALETSRYPYSSLDDILTLARSRDELPLLLLLDLLKDPQNVGSLVRTAEAVGVHGMVIQRRRAVGITPAVVHTSAGAVEHMLVAQVTNLVRAIESLKERDVWVAGLEAVRDAQLYHQTDLNGALALVVGSEGQGLRRLVQERCDFLLQLPILGRVTSLNASVAGSVVLYDALRQRQSEQA